MTDSIGRWTGTFDKGPTITPNFICLKFSCAYQKLKQQNHNNCSMKIETKLTQEDKKTLTVSNIGKPSDNVFKHLNGNLQIEQITAESPEFNSVLRLRTKAYGRDEAGKRDAIDDYSLHFIARQGGDILGAARATCRCHGPLESESFYPNWIIEEFGDSMCAGSRLCVDPKLKTLSSIPFELMKFAWSILLPLGVRIDVSKVRLKAVPFYLKMGHYFVRDSIFEFDRWNIRCALVAYPVNPYNGTKLADVFRDDVFRDIDRPCDLSKSSNRDKFTASYREFVAQTKFTQAENI